MTAAPPRPFTWMGRALRVALLVGVATAAGWALAVLQRERADLTGRMQRADTSRNAAEQRLTLLGAEHQQLIGAYEALKARWQATETEFTTLSATAADAQAGLSQASRIRAQLEQQLADARREETQLAARVALSERELEVLRERLGAASTEKTELAATLTSVQEQTGALEGAVAEMSSQVSARDETMQQLRERVLELSRAYEQLAALPAPLPPAQPSSPPTPTERSVETVAVEAPPATLPMPPDIAPQRFPRRSWRLVLSWLLQ